MSFTLPSSDSLHRGHTVEVQYQGEELIEDTSLYEDFSMQNMLTFPRQYYSIAFAVEDLETDLAAEVVEEEDATLDNIAEDVVNHVFFSLQMEEEAACMRFVDDFVTSVIHNVVSFVEAEEEDAILDRARNIITDVIEKVSYDIFINDLISITIDRAISDVDVISCRQIKDSSDPKRAQTENPSGKQQDSDCIQQPMTNPLSLATTPAASEPVLVEHHESVNKLTTSTTHVADFEIPDSVMSEGEVSQREVDPVNRPRKRGRIETLLRGIGRSLSHLGRPFVPCFGGG